MARRRVLWSLSGNVVSVESVEEEAKNSKVEIIYEQTFKLWFGFKPNK